MKNMSKKKKIATIATSFACLTAIVAGTVIGTNAYFVDRKDDNTKGVAGEVEIAPEQISINNMSAYITGNGVDIDMGRYMTTSGSIEGSNGWIPEKGQTISEYTPIWLATFHEDDDGYLVKDGDSYKCDSCGATFSEYDSNSMEQAYLYPNFFRTKDGEVAYCMDNGKIEPSDGLCNMSTPVSDKTKRILMKGYPQTKGSDYGISDKELEWCTQIALYISEGTAYDEDGTLILGDEMKLSDFGTYYTYQSDNEDQAEKLLNVIEKLIDASTDSSIEISNFKLNASSIDIKKDGDGYLVGPYTIETNVDEAITLTASDASVVFKDIDGNEITSLTGSKEFYAYVPNDVSEDVTITAEAENVNILPSYYYWSGRSSEQKMAVASLMPAKVTAHIKSVQELMPGDVWDLSWTVENTGNKSIVTRNTMYLYWEYDGTTDTENANGNESIYLYQQNTDAADIRTDMLTKAPSNANLVNMGAVTEFTLNGETHEGYKFTVMGDDLDGTGNSAETGISREVDYGSEYDDTDSIRDVISYKLALSQFANINTSGQKLHVVVVTEAMQYQNTDDSDWQQVGYAETVIGD